MTNIDKFIRFLTGFNYTCNEFNHFIHMKAIAAFSIIPVRKDPSHRSEMVNQLQFSDLVDVFDYQNEWSFIESIKDEYRGWCMTEQLRLLSEADAQRLFLAEKVYTPTASMLITSIDQSEQHLLPIGTPLPINKEGDIDLGYQQFRPMDTFTITPNPQESILSTAKLFLNTPYLWGGKSIYGIDCSGFSQILYAMHGYNLKRDASQQITQGIEIPCLSQAEKGDLAFFESDNGKITHVGLLIDAEHIIHASSYVRISKIDEYGICHDTDNTHTHRLKSIKRIFR